MSDDFEVYVGHTRVRDASLFGWQNYSEVVFSELDFVDRPRRSTSVAIRERYAFYEDDAPPRYRYFLAPSDIVRRRLRIQGYTPEFCERAWDAARLELAGTWRTLAQSESLKTIAEEAAAIEALTFSNWLTLTRDQDAAAKQGRHGGHLQPWHAERLLDSINDPLLALALLCEALGPTQVWMDCGFLYDDEEAARTPQQLAREEAEQFADDLGGRIIVLTEGKSDTRLISAALRAFYPEFESAYQFINFDEFRIPGGASPLAGMVKTLSGARMQNRLLALFDNDAAGVEAMRSLGGVKLPRNVRLMLLPDIGLARNYPTLGPDGLKRMDVNGSAGAIELYLGKTSLTDDAGALRPVRWTQWNTAVERYQGAVADKDGVARAFEGRLAERSSAKALRRDHPEMDLLLRCIFEAFEDHSPLIL